MINLTEENFFLLIDRRSGGKYRIIYNVGTF